MFATFPPRCLRFAALVMLVWAVTLATVVAEDRVLIFPEDRSVGVVSQGQNPTKIDGCESMSWEFKRIGAARGEVRVPEESFIQLSLNPSQVGDLSFLRDLAPGSIQSLLVERMTLDQTKMMQITGLQSLVDLAFDECDFASNAFEKVPALRQLLDLTVHRTIAQRPNGGPDDIAMADWIARSKRIEILSCRPALSTEGFQSLRNHPRLAFFNVRIGEDAEELLGILQGMPNLYGLNVDVASEEDGKSLGDLKWPPKVEVYYWSNGRIDAALLRGLSPKNRLRVLRFNDIVVADDFLAGLKVLTHLEELSIEPSNRRQARAILRGAAPVLTALPKLKNWPRLSNVDSESWNLICSTDRIESITISGVAEDVTEEHMLNLCRLRNLMSLNLYNLPLNDRVLESFSTLRNLESLRVLRTKVSGSGFRALEVLKKLRRVDIDFDPDISPTLSPLAGLRALEWLDVMNAMQIHPASVSALYDCKELRHLSLRGTLVDDSTAVWLGQMPNLNELYLSTRSSDNSSMTDRGLRALSLSRSLEWLSVGGFFTPDGAAALTRIPSLRSISLSVHGLSEQQRAAFERKLQTIPSVQVGEYLPDLTIGQDGLFRDGAAKLRESLDRLELHPAAPIADEVSATYGEGSYHLNELRGKVVLVAFWSTQDYYSTAALMELHRLHQKYHRRGLRIVGVHGIRLSDGVPEYLDKHSLPWPTVIDKSGKIESAYHVVSVPTIYLIDGEGVLRVAGVHRLGLEDAVQTLLEEPGDGEDGKR